MSDTETPHVQHRAADVSLWVVLDEGCIVPKWMQQFEYVHFLSCIRLCLSYFPNFRLSICIPFAKVRMGSHGKASSQKGCPILPFSVTSLTHLTHSLGSRTPYLILLASQPIMPKPELQMFPPEDIPRNVKPESLWMATSIIIYSGPWQHWIQRESDWFAYNHFFLLKIIWMPVPWLGDF